MLVYRVIPSLKKEFLYYKDENENCLHVLEDNGYGGYPVGTVLNELFALKVNDLFQAECHGKKDLRIPFSKDIPKEKYPVLSSAFMHMDLLRGDLCDESDLVLLRSSNRWDKRAVYEMYRHLIINFTSFNQLDYRLQTDEFRDYSISKIRAARPFNLIPDGPLSSREKVRICYQVAFFAYQEGLCAIAEENQKTLGISPEAINSLREMSFRMIEKIGIDRTEIAFKGIAFAKAFRTELEARPSLEPDALFALLDDLVDCYAGKDLDSAKLSAPKNLISELQDNRSFNEVADILIKIQQNHDYSLIGRNGTYEFYHALFQIGTAGIVRNKVQPANNVEYPLLYRVEQLLGQYISVPLKANLRNTMFEIEDIFDLLTVLCKGANLAGVKPTTCPECGRPFIPASGKNATKYCPNYNNTYGMTCSEASRKHRIKQDKPDPNDFKARALRKAKRAKQDSTKDYFTQIAEFIKRLGPIYRNSKKISSTPYKKWLELVCEETIKTFENNPDDASYYLIWNGEVVKDKSLFKEQLEADKEIPGLSDWQEGASILESNADLAVEADDMRVVSSTISKGKKGLPKDNL